MMLVDALEWGSFTRIDPLSTMQMVALFVLALVLMPVVMRLFPAILRFAFIMISVIAPVYILLPMLQ
jgi:hypothetical protein